MAKSKLGTFLSLYRQKSICFYLLKLVLTAYILNPVWCPLSVQKSSGGGVLLITDKYLEN